MGSRTLTTVTSTNGTGAIPVEAESAVGVPLRIQLADVETAIVHVQASLSVGYSLKLWFLSNAKDVNGDPLPVALESENFSIIDKNWTVKNIKVRVPSGIIQVYSQLLDALGLPANDASSTFVIHIDRDGIGV